MQERWARITQTRHEVTSIVKCQSSASDMAQDAWWRMRHSQRTKWKHKVTLNKWEANGFTWINNTNLVSTTAYHGVMLMIAMHEDKSLDDWNCPVDRFDSSIDRGFDFRWWSLWFSRTHFLLCARNLIDGSSERWCFASYWFTPASDVFCMFILSTANSLHIVQCSVLWFSFLWLHASRFKLFSSHSLLMSIFAFSSCSSHLIPFISILSSESSYQSSLVHLLSISSQSCLSRYSTCVCSPLLLDCEFNHLISLFTNSCILALLCSLFLFSSFVFFFLRVSSCFFFPFFLRSSSLPSSFLLTPTTEWSGFWRSEWRRPLLPTYGQCFHRTAVLLPAWPSSTRMPCSRTDKRWLRFRLTSGWQRILRLSCFRTTWPETGLGNLCFSRRKCAAKRGTSSTASPTTKYQKYKQL